MKNYYLILLAFCFFVSSCVQMRGIGDDYKYLTPYEKTLIEPFKKENSLKMSRVYKTNATTLLDALKEYPKAFVYVYTVGCTGDACKPLTVYEEYAKKNGYKVFFVLTSYMDLDIALLEPRNTPLFVIDSKYYGNKLFRAYVNDFKNELKGRDRKVKGEYEGGLLFYENGVYQKSHFYLPATTN
ncbi:hypothetical protein SAMN05421741_109138 [Paenimyroides ummariense]|uniref:Uncharacterized protein n=1 Tax=Paenimyroides ummariense TaxID=913024 RepID=A0A1I5BB85_9FLAO|nr:hypothetical protein [Paenimyroides ummariense]SFN71973.1 hypothetical protein SAMN05421741_109138 [Paenimyroides ummariense]